MSRLAQRLSELRRYLDHLGQLRARPISPEALCSDLSLRNDVVHSLLMVAQMVIDIAGELSASHALSFSDYREAVENLRQLGFPGSLVDHLARLPGFLSVVLHRYLRLDEERVLAALGELEPVEEFLSLVAGRLQA